MSSNDVAEIQATLKNIGVSVTPEQIENKLRTLAGFNATRSLARSAGVDPSALYKGSSTPRHQQHLRRRLPH
jgi:PIN domain nuclease of toxin-antitoxin system